MSEANEKMISLNEMEYRYLMGSAFLPHRWKEKLRQSAFRNDAWQFPVNVEQADEIREMLQDQFQLCGLEDDYQITYEGLFIESLIDKFFIEDMD